MFVYPSSGRDWEATLREWKKPSSDTEQARCQNAERIIKESIAESPALAGRTINVFPQGSYRNNTNVRLDSDVDICVLCTDTYFTDYSMAPGASDSTTGAVPASCGYAQFKNDVGSALVKKFGANGWPTYVDVSGTSTSGQTGWRLSLQIKHGTRTLDGVTVAQEAVVAWRRVLATFGLT